MYVHFCFCYFHLIGSGGGDVQEVLNVLDVLYVVILVTELV